MSDDEFSREQVAEWTQQVEARRRKIRRVNEWKNDRLVPASMSRRQERDLRFAIGWITGFAKARGMVIARRDREHDSDGCH